MQTLYIHDIKSIVLRPIQTVYNSETDKTNYYRELVVQHGSDMFVITLYPKATSPNQLQVTSEASALL